MKLADPTKSDALRRFFMVRDPDAYSVDRLAAAYKCSRRTVFRVKCEFRRSRERDRIAELGAWIDSLSGQLMELTARLEKLERRPS